MSADLGELGRQVERQKQIRRDRAVTSPPARPRLGVGPSMVGNRLKDVSLLAGETPPPPPTARSAPPVRTLKQEPAALVAVEEPLDKATIWLSPSDQKFLDEVSHAGHGRSPRVSLSRSAVTRLAITHLAEQMTPEEIVDALSRPTKQNGPGRKRR